MRIISIVTLLEDAILSASRIIITMSRKKAAPTVISHVKFVQDQITVNRIAKCASLAIR